MSTSSNLERIPIQNDIDVEQDIEIERERAENVGENIVLNSSDTFDLCRNYFDKKFSSLKRELVGKCDAPMKKRKTEVNLKFTSNQKQLDFNTSLDERIEEVVHLVKQGYSSKPLKRLAEIKSCIHKRNKLIKIADRSPGGWTTVAEYESDDLASDSEDEKKIRSAEQRALRKKNKPQTTTNFTTNSSFRPFNQRSSFNTRPPNQSISERPIYQRRQQKPEDICFICGKQGHWKKDCTTARTSNEVKETL